MSYTTDWIEERKVEITSNDDLEIIADIFIQPNKQQVKLVKDSNNRIISYNCWKGFYQNEEKIYTECIHIRDSEDLLQYCTICMQRGYFGEGRVVQLLEICKVFFPDAVIQGKELFPNQPFEKLPHSLEYYYSQALEIVQKQFPECTRNDLGDDYYTGYWNNKETFFLKDGAVDYPGDHYPSALNISEEQFVEIIAKEAIKKLSEAEK